MAAIVDKSRSRALKSLNSTVAMLPCGFTVGVGSSPPLSTRGLSPTVTVTPDSSAGAPSGLS